jgi:hypothetical protein
MKQVAYLTMFFLPAGLAAVCIYLAFIPVILNSSFPFYDRVSLA